MCVESRKMIQMNLFIGTEAYRGRICEHSEGRKGWDKVAPELLNCVAFRTSLCFPSLTLCFKPRKHCNDALFAWPL